MQKITFDLPCCLFTVNLENISNISTAHHQQMNSILATSPLKGGLHLKLHNAFL
jgi:hypothetical protein